MEQRHQEYADYYKARHARYAASKLYPEAAAAEAAMVECITTAPTLEAWGEEMQRRNLNIACAVGLSRDQATADAALYDEIEEPVRAAGPKRILSELTGAQGLTAADVASKVATILNENSKEITVDELVNVFHGNLDILEELEIYATAEMPDAWRADYAKVAADDVARNVALWQDVVLPNNRMWDPEWEFDELKIWETRFRRLIPMPDAVVKRRLQQFRSYRGSE